MQTNNSNEKTKTEIKVKDCRFYLDQHGIVTDKDGYFLCQADLGRLHLWVNVTVVDDNFNKEDPANLATHLGNSFDAYHREIWEERGFQEESQQWVTFNYGDETTENAWSHTLYRFFDTREALENELAWVYEQEIDIVL